MVDPPQELDLATRQEPGQIAGAIEAFPRSTAEGIGHEALRGQPGLPEIGPGEARTADTELSGQAGRDGLHLTVQQVDPGVGDRPADGDAAAGKLARERGDAAPDRPLGRAVLVVEGPRAALVMARDELRRARLAGHDDRLQGGELPRRGLGQHERVERRQGDHVADPGLGDQGVEALRIELRPAAGQHQGPT